MAASTSIYITQLFDDGISDKEYHPEEDTHQQEERDRRSSQKRNMVIREEKGQMGIPRQTDRQENKDNWKPGKVLPERMEVSQPGKVSA